MHTLFKFLGFIWPESQKFYWNSNLHSSHQKKGLLLTFSLSVQFVIITWYDEFGIVGKESIFLSRLMARFGSSLYIRLHFI